MKSTPRKSFCTTCAEQLGILNNDISRCSCTKCDSFDCFALRNTDQCTCTPTCKGSESCSSKTNSKEGRNQTTDNEKTAIHKGKNIPNTDSIFKEHVKKEIIYEHSIDKNGVTIKKPYVTKEVVYEYDNDNNVKTSCVKREITQKYNQNGTEAASETSRKDKNIHDCSNNIKEPIKKSCASNNDGTVCEFCSNYSSYDTNLTDKYREPAKFNENFIHAKSTSVLYAHNDDGYNSAKLSAQIMNVPYKEFKESISCNTTDSPASINKKLAKIDIFKRIKDAYRACSCKVCECLASKAITARNNCCNCKPCDCKDCESILRKNKQYFIGCPCIRCSRRNECKGLVKKANSPSEYCDCDMCDSEKYSELNNPCNCKPCECIECKSYGTTKIIRTMGTIVVGSMREDIPRAYCQCSPCECAGCSQDRPIASSLMHEMSTGISRPANCLCDGCMSQSCETSENNSCTCEVQRRVMRKPVEKDTRDYDIHRASVKNIGKTDNRNRNDTIAMFAAVQHKDPRLDPINKNACCCGDCECVECSFKDNTATFNQTSQLFKFLSNTSKFTKECPKNEYKDNEIYQWNSYCADLPKPSSSSKKDYETNFLIRNETNDICKCSPCECNDCKRFMYKCTKGSCYRSKFKYQKYSVQEKEKFINDTVCKNILDYFPLPYMFSRRFNEFENCKPISEAGTLNHQSRKNVTGDSSLEDLDNDPVKDIQEGSVPKCLPHALEEMDHETLGNQAFAQEKDKTVTMQYWNCNTVSFGKTKLRLVKEKLSKSSDLKYRFTPQVSGLVTEPCNILCDLMKANFQENSTNDVFKQKEKSEEPSILGINEGNTSNFVNLANNSHLNKVHNSNNFPGKNNLSESREELKELLSIKKSDEHNCKEININRDNEDKRKMVSVRDLSNNLVTSLRNANRKLSILMQPNFYQNSSDLGPSKANICLPKIPSKIEQENHSSDLCVIDIGCDQINSTLQQAKAFSDELKQLLNKYKRANQRLCKRLSNQVISNDNSTTNRSDEEMPRMTKNVSRNLNEETNQTKLLPNYDPSVKYGFHDLNIEKNREEVTQDNIYPSDGNVNLRKNIERRNNWKIIANEMPTITSTLNEKLYDRAKNEKTPLMPPSNKWSDDRNLYRSDKKSNKERKRGRVMRSDVVCKRFKLKEALINLASKASATSTYTLSHYDKSATQNDERGSSGQDNINKNRIKCDTTMSTSAETREKADTRSFRQQVQMVKATDEDVSWSILRKNCLIDAISALQKDTSGRNIEQNTKDFTEESSLLDFKPASTTKAVSIASELTYFKVASSQTCNIVSGVDEATDCMDDTFSVLLLKRQIRELLENKLNFTHPAVKKSLKMISSSPRASLSTKRSHDPLKIKFLSLRRVSDHTVLVKWKVPRDVNNVQGYELLVDGRTVQKIINPTRCMAVVTCLPHVDKVLIMIRTLVTSAVQCAHYPSSTIVYRMRNK